MNDLVEELKKEWETYEKKEGILWNFNNSSKPHSIPDDQAHPQLFEAPLRFSEK